MSEKRTYKIGCPKCGHGMDVVLHESINVKAEPELKEQLMLNKVNAVVCPQCEQAFRVDKPLLYNDPDRRLLIYWIPVAEDQVDIGEEKYGDWLREMVTAMPDGMQTPVVHLVFTRTELVERIFLKEAGLDERIIEYVKYLIYAKNAGKLDPLGKLILFNAQDSTEQALRFVVQDAKTKQFESMLEYSRDAYKALIEAFGQEDKTADLLEMFPGPYISARAVMIRELESEPQELEEPESD